MYFILIIWQHLMVPGVGAITVGPPKTKCGIWGGAGRIPLPKRKSSQLWDRLRTRVGPGIRPGFRRTARLVRGRLRKPIRRILLPRGFPAMEWSSRVPITAVPELVRLRQPTIGAVRVLVSATVQIPNTRVRVREGVRWRVPITVSHTIPTPTKGGTDYGYTQIVQILDEER